MKLLVATGKKRFDATTELHSFSFSQAVRMGSSGKEMSTHSGNSKKKDNSKTPRRTSTKTPIDATTPVKTAYTPGGLSCVTAKSIRSSTDTSSMRAAKNMTSSPAGMPKAGNSGNMLGSVKSVTSGVDQIENTVESIFRETSQNCDQVHSRAENTLRTAILKKTPDRNTTSSASTPKTPITARSAVDTPKSGRIVRLCMMKTPDSQHIKTTKSPFQATPKTAISSTKSTKSMAEKTAKESRLHERTIGGLKQGTVFGQSRSAIQNYPGAVSSKSMKTTPSKTMKVPVCITPTKTAIVPPNTPATPADGVTSTPLKTALSPSWMACQTTTGTATPKTAHSTRLTPALKSTGNTVIMAEKSTRKSSASSNKTSRNPAARRLFLGNVSSKSVEPSTSKKSNQSTKSRKSCSVDGSHRKKQAKGPILKKTKKSTEKKKKEKMTVVENSQSTESSTMETDPREEIVWTATTADDGFKVVVRMGMTTVSKGEKKEALTTKRIVVKGEKVFGG